MVVEDVGFVKTIMNWLRENGTQTLNCALSGLIAFIAGLGIELTKEEKQELI